MLGNSVPHLHTHIVPRYADDPRPGWPFPFPDPDPPPMPDDRLDGTSPSSAARWCPPTAAGNPHRLGDEVMRERFVSGADPGRYVGALVVVAGGYYLVGRIGLELAYLDGAVAALWPPAGFGLAVLFLYGIRLWPAVVVGDLLLGDYSTPLGTVLAQTVGNTLAVVVGALSCGV